MERRHRDVAFSARKTQTKYFRSFLCAHSRHRWQFSACISRPIKTFFRAKMVSARARSKCQTIDLFVVWHFRLLSIARVAEKPLAEATNKHNANKTEFDNGGEATGERWPTFKRQSNCCTHWNWWNWFCCSFSSPSPSHHLSFGFRFSGAAIPMGEHFNWDNRFRVPRMAKAPCHLCFVPYNSVHVLFRKIAG